MEKLTLEDCVNQMSEAYATLDNAKSDCNDVLESALDAYFGDVPIGVSKKERKEILAARKTEIKNIKKLAKAMMIGSKDEVQEEADNMMDLIATLG